MGLLENLVEHSRLPHEAAVLSRQSWRDEMGWRTSTQPVHACRDLEVDSGSTWHIHNVLSDLIHVRPCADTVEDVLAEKECGALTMEISRSLSIARSGKKYNFFFAE